MLNASKCSDGGAAISPAVAVDRVFLELLVSDHGIGVEKAELPLPFEPFSKFAMLPVLSGAASA